MAGLLRLGRVARHRVEPRSRKDPQPSRNQQQKRGYGVCRNPGCLMVAGGRFGWWANRWPSVSCSHCLKHGAQLDQVWLSAMTWVNASTFG